MLRWLRSHVDPDEALVILFAIFCVWRGLAAWDDLVGKPRDAPHLRVPGHERAVLWWGCAFVGIVALRLPRGCWARRWAHSFVGMGFMTSFVFGSYLASWMTSWGPIDWLVDDDIVKGDPHAWGSMPLYFLGLVAMLALMLAPYDWTYLDRQARRPGRLERRR